MTEPEIARRCPSCGASIRSLAFFCPQCGKQLSEQKSETAQSSTSVVTAPLVDVPPSPDPPNVVEPTALVVPPGKEPVDTIAEKPKDIKLKEPSTQPQKPTDGRAVAGAGRARIQRATTLAKDVEGDVIHRVQKLREISTVVLDEAGYDPSLRFVLVAAFLFILFLVIVFLNKLIS
jgi:predicted RNA-binding Zn-ribbon protein involved in translation (DUF1610 family)